jgi:hypothetical protein
MHITLGDFQVDRKRPTPLEGHRVEENDGTEIIESYDDETFTGYDGRTVRYPLPVTLDYEIDTWSHSAQQQLSMDQKILQTFPERGVVTLPIGEEEYDFPIELVGIENLDDLALNLRERLYRFRLEAWIKSAIPDEQRKIIQSSEINVREGNTPEDVNLPGKNIPWVSILDEPDE